MKTNSSRRYNIDFLRFFLVIIIVYYHFIGHSYSTSYGEPFITLCYNSRRAGNICNSSLFMISGFFLYYSILKTDSFLAFVKHKVFRIWPCLAFVILCIAVCSVFGKVKFDIGQNFLNLCFIHMNGSALTTKLSNANVTWFVCTLFWLSLFFFCIFKIAFKNSQSALFFISLLCWITLSMYINNPGPETFTVLYGMLSKSMAGAMACTSFGILIAAIFEKTNIKNMRLNFYIASICEISILFYIVRGLIFIKFKEQYTTIIILISILFILFLLRGGVISKWIDNKYCSFIGKYAFSIYIMQGLSFVLFKSFLWKLKVLVTFSPYLMICISLLVSILIGVVTYHFIERPVAKYLKRFE